MPNPNDAALDPLTARKPALEAWLRREDIDMPEDADIRTLRATVVRRMKRKRRVCARELFGAVFGANTALSVADLKKIAVDIHTNGLECRRSEKVIFKLDDISDEMLVTRHMPDCKGTISNGICRKCGDISIGRPVFKFELVIVDLKDPDVMLEVGGANGVGQSIFKDKGPELVKNMDRSDIDDIIESWTEVPILAQVFIVYTPEQDKVMMYPFNMRKLPMSYLPE